MTSPLTIEPRSSDARRAAIGSKVTLRLDPEANALLRLGVEHWGRTQGEIVGLALRYFAAVGAITATQLSFSDAAEQRVASALEQAQELLARVPAQELARRTGE